AAATGTDQQRHFPVRNRHVDATQGANDVATGRIVLGHTAAPNGAGLVDLIFRFKNRGHRAPHLKTIPGSRIKTRRRLRMLESKTSTPTAAPVTATTCQGRYMPRKATLFSRSVVSKNAAASPMPIPKPITPTATACNRTMPISRLLVTPMALRLPNC